MKRGLIVAFIFAILISSGFVMAQTLGSVSRVGPALIIETQDQTVLGSSQFKNIKSDIGSVSDKKIAFFNIQSVQQGKYAYNSYAIVLGQATGGSYSYLDQDVYILDPTTDIYVKASAADIKLARQTVNQITPTVSSTLSQAAPSTVSNLWQNAPSNVRVLGQNIIDSASQKISGLGFGQDIPDYDAAFDNAAKDCLGLYSLPYIDYLDVSNCISGLISLNEKDSDKRFKGCINSNQQGCASTPYVTAHLSVIQNCVNNYPFIGGEVDTCLMRSSSSLTITPYLCEDIENQAVQAECYKNYCNMDANKKNFIGCMLDSASVSKNVLTCNLIPKPNFFQRLFGNNNQKKCISEATSPIATTSAVAATGS